MLRAHANESGCTLGLGGSLTIQQVGNLTAQGHTVASRVLTARTCTSSLALARGQSGGQIVMVSRCLNSSLLPTVSALTLVRGRKSAIYGRIAGARIGGNCNINSHCFVSQNTVVIGTGVTVKCGVYLWDGVTLEDNVMEAQRDIYE